MSCSISLALEWNEVLPFASLYSDPREPLLYHWLVGMSLGYFSSSIVSPVASTISAGFDFIIYSLFQFLN